MIINNLLIQEQTIRKANGHKSNVGLLWRRSWFAIRFGVWCWFVELDGCSVARRGMGMGARGDEDERR